MKQGKKLTTEHTEADLGLECWSISILDFRLRILDCRLGQEEEDVLNI